MAENNFNFDIDTFICPFITNSEDEHLEISNNQNYFIVNGDTITLKDIYRQEISEDTIVFINEEKNEDLALDLEKCIEAIAKAQRGE